MSTNTETMTLVAPADLPVGFALRNWQDISDFEKMRRVLIADKHSQGIEEAISTTDLQAHLESIPGMQIKSGVFLVELKGEVIAYQTMRGHPEVSGLYTYTHHGFVLPAFKKRGIGLALIRHSESILREIATEHPADAPKTFQVFLESKQTDLIQLLEQQGYSPVRYFYTMLRPDLENIPNMPLPQGIETRPVKPEHMRAIWGASVDAFSEHWGETKHSDDEFELWLKRPFIQPEFWQIAWEGDRIISLVLNSVDEDDNTAYNRKRGFTEDIGTLKEYRGRGIAQALITRGLRQFHDLGFTEAALDVDTENGTGALKLYEKLGYRPIRTFIAYRKPFTV